MIRCARIKFFNASGFASEAFSFLAQKFVTLYNIIIRYEILIFLVLSNYSREICDILFENIKICVIFVHY